MSPRKDSLTTVAGALCFAVFTVSTALVASARDDGMQPGAPAASGDHAMAAAEQVVRGRASFQGNCTNGCHMPELTAGEIAPALAGDSFLQHWKGLSVEELFERIRDTMPQKKPHSLSDPVYVDIVAFLLHSNRVPYGNSRLESDPDALQSIIIVQSANANAPALQQE